MFKAGLKEIALLEKLKENDPESKSHSIQLLSHFEYKVPINQSILV
jgi:hypothetical protein